MRRYIQALARRGAMHIGRGASQVLRLDASERQQATLPLDPYVTQVSAPIRCHGEG